MSAPRLRKARPYSDFLTPSLHRRFTGAALGSLVVSYAVAVWLGGITSFWSWFPIGPAIIRTLLVFVCSLVVYFLRIGHIHVGSSSTTSALYAVTDFAIWTKAAQVCFWYTVSAYTFFVIYLTAAPASADLGLVIHGKPHERQRLNERPVYLGSLFLWTALIQGVVHLYKTLDRVPLPVTADSAPTPSLLLQLRQRLVKIGDATFKRALFSTSTGFAAYFVLIRRIALRLQYSMVSRIYTISAPRGVELPALLRLTVPFFFASMFLLVIWESANTLFNIFLSQPPLKQGQPLTNYSNDPNGSLISGMRRPKEFSRNMAFWELSIIARSFQPRRQTLYAEFQRPDRPGGSSWTAILRLCLDEVASISARINGPSRSVAPSTQPQQASAGQVESLPKIAQPILKENIWQNAPPPKSLADGIVDAFGNFARAHGNSAGAADPITPRAKMLLEGSVDRVLTPEQKAHLKPAAIEAKAKGLIGDFLRLPFLGQLFRQTFARQTTSVVCGGPYSRTGTITSAVDALTQLCMHSLTEDKHGVVQMTVLEIIRCLATAIRAIETYLKVSQPHWTDVEFKDDDRLASGEVKQVLTALKAGLGQLLLTFGEYLDYLGASADEVRAYKGLVEDWQKQQDDMQRLQRLQATG